MIWSMWRSLNAARICLNLTAYRLSVDFHQNNGSGALVERDIQLDVPHISGPAEGEHRSGRTLDRGKKTNDRVVQ